MLHIDIRAVEKALAGPFARVVGCAEPAWDVEVLRDLMSLPVGLAAEGFGAVGESASVRSFVALLMFSDTVRIETSRRVGGCLLHFTAEPGLLWTRVALEPVLFFGFLDGLVI